MPAPYIKEMAEKHHKSADEMEKIWEKAKKQAEKENQGENYAYITAIFNNMIGEKDK